MWVAVNGEDRTLEASATVAEVVQLLDLAPGARGVAVALDGEVVIRGAWSAIVLSGGRTDPAAMAAATPMAGLPSW